MQRAVTLLLAAATVSTCCGAAELEPQPEGPPPICAIRIEFRARQGEIDLRTLDRVLRFVSAEPAVEKAYDERRGEDEPSSMCLVIGSARKAIEVYEQLTRVIPPRRARLPRMMPTPAVVLRYLVD